MRTFFQVSIIYQQNTTRCTRVDLWTHCPFGTSHITGCTLCQFGTSGSEGGRVGFLVSCTRVEFLPTVLYEHSFCLVLLDSYIFQVSIIDQQHTNRCTRVDFLPTGIYERSVGLICLDSYSFPSFHYWHYLVLVAGAWFVVASSSISLGHNLVEVSIVCRHPVWDSSPAQPRPAHAQPIAIWSNFCSNP